MVCTAHERWLKVFVYNDMPMISTPSDSRIRDAALLPVSGTPPVTLVQLANLDQAALRLGADETHLAESLIAIRARVTSSDREAVVPASMAPLSEAMRARLGDSAAAALTALTGRKPCERSVSLLAHASRTGAVSSAIGVQFAFAHGLTAEDLEALAREPILSKPKTFTTACGARQCRCYKADWSFILGRFVSPSQQFARTECPTCGFVATVRWGVVGARVVRHGTATKAVLAELVEFGITKKKDLERITGLNRWALNEQIQRLPPGLRARVSRFH